MAAGLLCRLGTALTLIGESRGFSRGGREEYQPDQSQRVDVCAIAREYESAYTTLFTYNPVSISSTTCSVTRNDGIHPNDNGRREAGEKCKMRLTKSSIGIVRWKWTPTHIRQE